RRYRGRRMLTALRQRGHHLPHGHQGHLRHAGLSGPRRPPPSRLTVSAVLGRRSRPPCWAADPVRRVAPPIWSAALRRRSGPPGWGVALEAAGLGPSRWGHRAGPRVLTPTAKPGLRAYVRALGHGYGVLTEVRYPRGEGRRMSELAFIGPNGREQK